MNPLIATIVLQAALCGLLSAQTIVPFPTADWAMFKASYERTPLVTPGFLAAHGSSLRAVSPLSRPSSTVAGPGYFFSAVPWSGVIFVFHVSRTGGRTPVAGLDTGFDGVTNVELAVGQPALPPGIMILSATGFTTSNGVTSTAIWTAWLDTNSCLSGCTPFSLPAGVAPGPGEAFSATYLVGTTAYVIETSSATMVRFLDTNGDNVPDTRDPLFAVDMTDGGICTTYNVPAALRPCDPALGECRVISWGGIGPEDDGEPEVLPTVVREASPGHFIIDTVVDFSLPDSVAFTLNRPLAIRRLALGGAMSFEATGPVGSTIAAEAFDVATSTWMSLDAGAQFIVDKGFGGIPMAGFRRLTLQRPLIAGESIRLVTLFPSYTAGPPMIVNAKRPRIESTGPDLQTNWTNPLIHLTGHNLDGSWVGAVALVSSSDRILVAATSTNPSVLDVTFTAPTAAIAGEDTSGTLTLKNQATGETIWVWIRIEP